MDNNAAIVALLIDRQREIEALRSQCGDLLGENTQLRQQLAASQAPVD